MSDIQRLGDDQRLALVNLARVVFENNEPLNLDGLVIDDTETGRQFVVNLEIKEVVSMTAGLQGKSKVN